MISMNSMITMNSTITTITTRSLRHAGTTTARARHMRCLTHQQDHHHGSHGRRGGRLAGDQASCPP
jgi:hypothetical protein